MSTSSVQTNITPLICIVMFCVLAVGNVAVSPAAAELRSRRVESGVPLSTFDIDSLARLPRATANRQTLAFGSIPLACLFGEQ